MQKKLSFYSTDLYKANEPENSTCFIQSLQAVQQEDSTNTRLSAINSLAADVNRSLSPRILNLWGNLATISILPQLHRKIMWVILFKTQHRHRLTTLY
jgi:hypothetical protein